MDLKHTMIKESLGYKGTKFENNLYFSNFIKSYGKAINDMGLLEAYVEFSNKENYKVMNFLNENINEVLYLSSGKSALLFEGYHKDCDTFELNEGIKELAANFLTKIIGQNKLKLALQRDLTKLKVTSYEQALPVVREIAKKGKIPLATLKAQIALGQKVANGEIDPKVAAFKTQQGINSVVKLKETEKTPLKLEEFFDKADTILLEYDPADKAMNIHNLEKQGKGQIAADELAKGGGLSGTQLGLEHPTNVVSGMDAASSMAAAAVLNKTISGFVMGIPVIGPLLAPFAPYIAGMLLPIVLGLVFRKKGK